MFCELACIWGSIRQEYKVYANYTRCPVEIRVFLYGLSPIYRLPSLNRAIAPRSANWARA